MDGYIPLLVMLKFSDHGCGCSDAVYSPSRKKVFGRWSDEVATDYLDGVMREPSVGSSGRSHRRLNNFSIENFRYRYLKGGKPVLPAIGVMS